METALFSRNRKRQRLWGLVLLAGAASLGCTHNSGHSVAQAPLVRGAEPAAPGLSKSVAPNSNWSRTFEHTTGLRPAGSGWLVANDREPRNGAALVAKTPVPRDAQPARPSSSWETPFEQTPPVPVSATAQPAAIKPAASASAVRRPEPKRPIARTGSPFAGDIDAQLAQLRASVIAEPPSTAEKNTETPGSISRLTRQPERRNPFEFEETTAAPESPFDRLAGSGPPSDASEQAVEPPPRSPVADVPENAFAAPIPSTDQTAAPTDSTESPLPAGEPDPAMIVESDALPPRLATVTAEADGSLDDGPVVRVSANHASVLELEGPGEAPRMFPTDLTMDPRNRDIFAAFETSLPADPAPPPPPEIRQSDAAAVPEFVFAGQESESSVPYAMKDIDWKDATQPPAKDGLASLGRPLGATVSLAGLIAIFAWLRLRRTAAA